MFTRPQLPERPSMMEPWQVEALERELLDTPVSQWSKPFGVSDMCVSPSPRPGMTVIIDFCGQIISLGVARGDFFHPRIDVVCHDWDTVSVVRGYPNLLPRPPDVPAGMVQMAQLHIPPHTTSITHRLITAV
jgi:hypothetical protein